MVVTMPPPNSSGPTAKQGHHQEHHQDHLSPFARAWRTYLDAGWQGIIPIATTWKGRASDGKFPPPAGFTGRHNAGVWPTVEDMATWAAQPHRWSNIALRPPDNVIGLDVDAYDGKRGDQTMAECEARWGELPVSWKSTSRDDGYSGVYWYRVPAGLVWPGKLPGGDVEIIQHGHRYAVVWPSRHPSGRLYVWWDPEDYSDTPAQWVPKIKELEELPAAWVAGLTQGKTASRRPGVVVNDRMRDHGPDARQWLTPGEPCQAVIRVLDHFGPASRHDTMVQAQVRLLRLGEQGHRGVRAALDTLESMFVEAVTADGSRDPALAEDEWRRALNDAPAVIVAQGLTHPMRRGCCMEVPRLLTVDEQHERFAYGRIEDFARLLDGEGADDV